jgi:hypothetical protein
MSAGQVVYNKYAGAGTAMQVEYGTNQAKLNYLSSESPDTTGFDQFGRIHY